MTKIFITIPWFLPAFRAGGPVQSVANLVKELNEDVEYFIFCGDVDLNGAVLENIQAEQWVPFNSYTKVWYASPGKISDTVVSQVAEVKPDILFIIGLFSWHFNIVPMMFCKGPKKILSTRGMLHPGALSQKKWKKRIYLRLFKLLEYHHKVHFHATDDEEKNFITTYFGKVPQISVAGNFPNNIAPLPVIEKQEGSLIMVTVALISPMKNTLLVLKALSKATAKIEYHIYGPIKDEGYWELCQQEIKMLPQNIGVVYHNEIAPENVPEALSTAHIFILPSKSENFGHAIYEALSAGRPVITSNNTPWRHLRKFNAGINVYPDHQDELLDAIEDFAEMDQQQMDEWSRQARQYAEAAVNVPQIKEQYHQLFGMMASSLNPA
jgi:glycosyltransferase involved in cell wall biosynthesis